MNNFKSIKKIIKQLNYVLQPSHKRRLFPLLVIMLTSGLLELLGVTIVLPFVQAILDPDVLMSNKWVAPMLDWLGIESTNGMLILFGVAIIVVYVLKNAYIIFSVYMRNDFSTTIKKDLSMKMLAAYMKRPYTFFIDTNSAEIVRGCNYDADGVYICVNALMGLITEAITTLMIAVFIVVSEPLIAIGVIATMVVTMLVIVLWYKPMLKRCGKAQMEADTERNKALFQLTQGVKEVYVTDRKEIFLSKYDEASIKHSRVTRNYNFLNQTPERIIEAMCITGIITFVMIRVVAGGDMVGFVPKMAAFVVAAFKMMPSIGRFAHGINELIFWRERVENSYNNIHDAQTYEQWLIKNGVQTEIDACETGTNDSMTVQKKFAEILEIRDVCWQYENATKRVLDGICLTIKKGEAVGFIGPSGSGKTTLADVILGLLRPQAGSVYMDGEDVFKMPHKWAKIIGYVPQSVFLIDDTIRENVVFGLSDYSDDDVWDALDRAALGDFVRSLPEGLDTVVGERGIKFSGGQRQRIAIARALFAKPDILVLDEATSALDNEAEKAIMESIDSLAGSVTLIIVAHRLTTIKNCDSIYRICDGKAVLQDKSEVLKDV